MKQTASFILSVLLTVSFFMCPGQNKKSSLYEMYCTGQGDFTLNGHCAMICNNRDSNRTSQDFSTSDSPLEMNPSRGSIQSSENRSSIEKGAIIGGISGLVVGTLAGSLTYPDNSLLEVLGGAIKGDDVSGSLNQEQVPFIVVGTLVGVAAGVLIGLKGNKSAMLEKKHKVEIQPVLASLPASKKKRMLISVQLNFN